MTVGVRWPPFGGPAVYQSLHELSQQVRFEDPVLHLVLDQVVPFLGEFLPFLVPHAFHADVVDRLPGLEQLDHLVDAFGLVARVAALGGQERREADSDERKG